MDDLGERLRRVLQSFAAATFPRDDGLERIRARAAAPRRPWWQRALARARRLAPRRQNESGAPGQGGAARNHDDDLGSHTP
jgi:hypothetical protein